MSTVSALSEERLLLYAYTNNLAHAPSMLYLEDFVHQFNLKPPREVYQFIPTLLT